MASLTRRINEVRDKMTDIEFFTSRAVENHFNDMISGVCKKYHAEIKVKIVFDKARWVARTNGHQIMVNLNQDWLEGKTRSEMYQIISGEVIHECGHILYTNFLLGVKAQDSLETKNAFMPEIEMCRALKIFLKKGKGKKLVSLYQKFDNCIEDGHIERRVLKDVPGYGEYLAKVRRLHIKDLRTRPYSSYDTESLGRTEKQSILLELVLCYAKYQIINTDEVIDDLTEAFYFMKEEIDLAVKSNNAFTRKSHVNSCFNIFFDYISKLAEDEKKEEKPEEKDASDESVPSEEDILSSSEEASEKSEDTESTDENDGSSECETDSSDNCEDPFAEDVEDSGKTEVSKEELEEMSDEELKDAISKALEELSDMDSDDYSEEAEHESTTPIADDEDESCTSLSPEGTEEVHNDGAEDITHLEKIAAEEMVASEEEGKIISEMKKFAKKTIDSRIDKCPSYVSRMEVTRTGERLYEELSSELNKMARRVEKDASKVIKERQIGDTLTNLYSGRRVEASQLSRKDKKYMSIKILPENVPDMAVCVLVDCSGSMSRGNRMLQSVKGAYVAWKFCENMNIPCYVYGHSTHNSNTKVYMMCAAHPSSLGKDDGKRILSLEPIWDNRDGWALNYCAEVLDSVSAKSKMLLVISDGMPLHGSYGEIIGKKDCQEVVAKYRKKGIATVVAGIDTCSDQIKHIYMDGASNKGKATFLDMTDMSRLPKVFAQIIKKELL